MNIRNILGDVRKNKSHILGKKGFILLLVNKKLYKTRHIHYLTPIENCGFVLIFWTYKMIFEYIYIIGFSDFFLKALIGLAVYRTQSISPTIKIVV